MSATRQFRARESEATSPADPEMPNPVPSPEHDDPLQLLRAAIAQLKSSNGDLPDQDQVANLLAETKDALERASVISRAMKQCEECLGESQFEKACEALDEGLAVYPDEAVLLSRRHEVEEQNRAFQSAAAARAALEEAEWLLEQDRTDLAVQFLKDKAAELPDEASVGGRLKEVEAELPQWEQKRQVTATLARVTTLEHIEQWQAALTIIEEALQTYPYSEELIGASRRVADRLQERESHKRLARRLEQIRQKIDAKAWNQAVKLLQTAEAEFPGSGDLKTLRPEVESGLRRSECEALAVEIRQWLSDGDLEQAEQSLRKGIEAFGLDPALGQLQQELETEKKFKEDLRLAQILFGRRQLQEAERMLAGLAAEGRPEAQALLSAVREARAAADEENFYGRGREKALELIQQQQYAQAADLLRNLLLLFPGNPILERDLAAARAGIGPDAAVPPPLFSEASPEPEPEPAYVPLPTAEEVLAGVGPAREAPPSRLRRVALAGTASIVLVSAAGAAWRLSLNRTVASSAGTPTPAATAPGSAAKPSVRPASTPADPAPTPAATSVSPARERERERSTGEAARTTPLRQFVPPALQASAQGQRPALPLPPGALDLVSAETEPGLPDSLGRPARVPVPPPAAPPRQPAPTVPVPAARPAEAVGGRIQEAVLVDRPLPAYPPLARERGIRGIVRLDATIDETGAVKDLKVVSGDPILSQAAANAVQKWKYRPAILNGKPIASDVRIQVSFGNQNK